MAEDPRARLDEGVEAADWNRSATWDVWIRGPGGALERPSTVDQVRALAAELGLSLEAYLDLPSSRAMPDDLRAAVEDVLESESAG